MGHDGDLAAPGGAVGAEEGRAHEAAADDAQAGMSRGERRLLAAMSLHAITAVYGEAGLRERLAIEAEVVAEAGRERIARALGLAARLHAGDRRQRESYLCHLLRVAIRVISGYRVRDADVVCAALLHDAVEDHAADLARVAVSMMPSGRWLRSSGTASPAWWRRSPMRRICPAATGTRATASMLRPACGPTRGPGSSRPLT